MAKLFAEIVGWMVYRVRTNVIELEQMSSKNNSEKYLKYDVW